MIERTSTQSSTTSTLSLSTWISETLFAEQHKLSQDKIEDIFYGLLYGVNSRPVTPPTPLLTAVRFVGTMPPLDLFDYSRPFNKHLLQDVEKGANTSTCLGRIELNRRRAIEESRERACRSLFTS
eukprot:snap_masked-scaffold_64-processed-gene-0.76-mRNA-1 protein AED:1.00 eAED:1.00 QI:0/-1/0/0/-1/1/1/0/124